MSRRPRWLVWSTRADLALALVVCASTQLVIVLSGGSRASVVSAAVGTLPLAGRRRAPLGAAFAVGATPVIDRALGGPGSMFIAGGLVAGYSVAAYATRRRAVLGGMLILAGVWLSTRWAVPAATSFSFVAVLLAVPWLAGRLAGEQRRQLQQLSVVAARLEREREAGARLAVVEERARMARELDDAIAHAVSQMIVQAAAAEAVLTSAPARARQALRAVQETGRDAITELRRMLRILRSDDGQRPSPSDPAEALPRAPARRIRLPESTRLDLLVALLCLAVAELEVLTETRYGTPRLASALLMLVATMPLIVRRRFPLAVLVTVVAAVAIQQVLVNWEDETPWTLLASPLLALYTLGAYATPRRTLAGATLTVVIAVAVEIAVAAEAATVGELLVGWSVLYWSTFVGLSVLSGRAVRVHRRRAEQLRVLTARLGRERDARARLAVMEERARVARELHDAIAHGVSVMVLQAGAAEQILAPAADQAGQAARAVQDTGRTVLEELRQLLGVLHTDEDESPRTPRPSLRQLDTLIAHTREAGLPVELRVDGEPTPLPAGVDASAYRVIQEGLTNALKHAGRVPTAVSLRYDPNALVLEILNAGDGALPRPEGEVGHGLIGMRERVELYGGELHAGPQPSGGYLVRARLPLRDELA